MSAALMNLDAGTRDGKEVAPPFIWYTRDGEELTVQQMKTSHLFWVIRMFWNHSAPENLQMLPFKRYKFSPRYTREYIRTALQEIMRELRSRKDLAPWMAERLNWMASHFGALKIERKTL